jgi:hypothetical protein
VSACARRIDLPDVPCEGGPSWNPRFNDVSVAGAALTRELIAAERKFIHVLLRDGKITDEARRRIERELDLKEASLSNREFRRIPL